MNAATFFAFGGPMLGTVIALITYFAGRGREKATAAREYTDMSMDVAKEIRELRVEMREMRGATEELIDVLRKDVIPLIEEDHPGVVLKLERAKARAERAI